MRSMLRLLVLAAALAAIGLYLGRGDACGEEGASACPDPSLANGLGTVIQRREACADAGYLCVGDDRLDFQVRRWALSKGRLRVRVPLPDVGDADEARRLRNAAVEGIRMWEGHPFGLEIDTRRIPLKPWDIELFWVRRPDIAGGAVGLARAEWSERDGRPSLSVKNIATVTQDPRDPEHFAPSEVVAAVSAHEMGHALGIMHHSDRGTDIPYPSDDGAIQVSPRDLQTVRALYRLPNGARVR